VRGRRSPHAAVRLGGAERLGVAGLAAIGCSGTWASCLTESYRYAPASVIAPYDYTAILFAFLLGYVMFGEVPTSLVSSRRDRGGGRLFVLWRERRLGLKRARDAKARRAGVTLKTP